MPYDPLLILGVFGLLLLLAFTVTAFGVMVAVTHQADPDASSGVMQMVVMPMFFLSGALYPVAGLPAWLAVLNRIDPLTYAVDPMRRLVFDHLDVIRDRAPDARPGRHLVRAGTCRRCSRRRWCWCSAWRCWAIAIWEFTRDRVTAYDQAECSCAS